MIQRTKGAQSIVFAEAPYIMSSASVVGKKESEGPLGELFDTFDETNLLGRRPGNWQKALCRGKRVCAHFIRLM